MIEIVVLRKYKNSLKFTKTNSCTKNNPQIYKNKFAIHQQICKNKLVCKISKTNL